MHAINLQLTHDNLPHLPGHLHNSPLTRQNERVRRRVSSAGAAPAGFNRNDQLKRVSCVVSANHPQGDRERGVVAASREAARHQ